MFRGCGAPPGSRPSPTLEGRLWRCQTSDKGRLFQFAAGRRKSATAYRCRKIDE